MKDNKPKIYLAVLNITSWAGISSDAEHVYGTLILSEQPGININNVEEYGSINGWGETIEIRKLTLNVKRNHGKIFDIKLGYFNVISGELNTFEL